MLIENIKVNVGGMEIEVAKNTTLMEISKMFNHDGPHKIVLARVNNRYRELSDIAYDGNEIEFCDLTDKVANRVYLNGLIFLVKYAFNEVFGKKNKIIVKHSADMALCIETTSKITKEDLTKIENKMKAVVEANLPIHKVTVLKSEAINYFEKVGSTNKVELLQYLSSSYVHLYKMGNMYNYIISKMPSETSCLNEFALEYLNNDEFILRYPTPTIHKKIKDYVHHKQLFEVFDETKTWGKLMNVETSNDLNNIVASGKINDLIRMQETLQNSKLLEQTRIIAKKSKDIKIVLVAGPSSSGKTTTTNKIAMYLRSLGMSPKMISMDNFFVNRIDTPKKANGEYDFECFEALDLKLFNKTIADLLNGKTVIMPEFNFLTGEKEFKKEMTLQEHDILLIEGIHALNPKLLVDIDNTHKFKIYLSPLTAVNIDEDNRMSTTDNRLLRRIIRDNRTRGYDVCETLQSWANVREGEEVYVFPYQDEADCVFNTSLIYEFCVLKTYVLPLLYSVKSDNPSYEEARRLIKILNVFLPIPSEAIPDDSILREFIGGSCF